MAVEKDFYPAFSRFIATEWANRPSAPFELKHAKGPRIYRNDIRPVQIRSLKMSKSPFGLYHKISDQSMGAKPWDSFIMKNCKEAFLVIIFGRSAYFIDIDAWLSATETSVSLTEDECASIASIEARL